MSVDVTALRPGHVIVMRTPDPGGWLIRRRSLMRRYPRQPWRWLADPAWAVNHVALFTHTDETGRPRGLEGRPGGFGWCNLDRYLTEPYHAIANTAQPLTDAQRDGIVRRAVSAVGMPYDWAAIVAFAAGSAGLPFLAHEWPEDGVPAQNVCSSAADYFYEAVGAANPGGYVQTRGTDPQAWWSWIDGELWSA